MNMRLPTNYRLLSSIERKHIRDEYIRCQKGLCCYCGAPLDGPPTADVLQKVINKRLFPKGFFDWPVHLHHDHDTGMTIGAVHCYCNAVAWQYDKK